jgi:glycerol uptake facilitator-like aquaporin
MVFSKRLSAKDTDGPITYRPVQKTQTRSVLVFWLAPIVGALIAGYLTRWLQSNSD